MARFAGRRLGLFVACATVGVSAPHDVFAQPTASEEIVVTATRRESALQEVPIAVTPVTAALVRNSGIRDLHDLTNVAPSLQFNVSENETSATARIRGVGTQGSNPGLESAVGVFIDGVYRARNGVALTDLGEISQIEVLRGPQGTLFGRNTSAGLITVATAGPDLSEFGMAGEATVGAFNERRISAHVTGPIVRDQLGFRVFAAQESREGFNDLVDDFGGRNDVNDRDLWTVRAQVLWAPSREMDLRLIGDITERDETCCAGVFYDPQIVNETAGEGYASSSPAQAIAAIGGFGPGGIAALGPSGLGDRTAFADRATTQVLTDSGVSAELNWQTGAGLLTVISAYRDWDFVQGQDIDFTAADMLYRAPGDGGFGIQVFSQEARFTGRNGPLDWLIGAFYTNEQLTRRDTLRIGADYGEYFAALGTASGNAVIIGAAPVLGSTEGGGQRDRYRQTGESIAFFSHNILALNDRTDVTFGLRFTQEDKDFEGVRQTIGALPAPLSAFPWHNASLDGTRTQARNEEEWSGVAAVRHDFADAISGYLSYARGYKGGGFNLDREFDGDNAFGSETVDSWELGAKTAWANGDLILNGAVFSAQYQDFQLNRFTGVSFVVSSIPEVRSNGAELDLIWRAPWEGLSMQGGIAYADAQYGDAGPWAVSGLERLPNTSLTNSPLWTVANAITYEWPLFNDAITGLAYLDFRYMSDQNTGSDLHPSKEQPAYVIMNGRVGFRTADERYALEFWGRNLLDEDFAQIMYDPPLQFLRINNPNPALAPLVNVSGMRGAFLGDPRTYGITVRARY
jgi:iron complex outermembrane recepter protein